MKFFVALDHLLRLVDSSLYHLDVRQDQLKVDGLDISGGVYAALDVDDIVVVKTAHNVNDRVALSDVAEELVAQSLALARALDQPRDIDKLNGGGGVLFGVVHLGELVQPLVGNGYHADVRLDGAEGIVRALRARVGNRVEQGGLADVRQSDDA